MEFQRCAAADGGKVIALIGRVLPLLELPTQGRLQILVLSVGIDSVQIAELRHQILSSLFSDAGDAGVVVGGVAHQRLEVDQPLGGEAVFLLKNRGGIVDGAGAPGLGGDQLDGDMLVYQLEGVPVAGDHHAVPAVFAADAPGGAENIVGLPALKRIGGNVHGGKDFL